MKIPLKWKTCTRYCVNTCTSTYPIFAVANFAKCNGPFTMAYILKQTCSFQCRFLRVCMTFQFTLGVKSLAAAFLTWKLRYWTHINYYWNYCFNLVTRKLISLIRMLNTNLVDLLRHYEIFPDKKLRSWECRRKYSRKIWFVLYRPFNRHFFQYLAFLLFFMPESQ